MKKTKKLIFNLSLSIFIILIVLATFARNGYGYMGYYGYFDGPSWWYWNDTHYYYDKSNRTGSVTGSRSRGGGPGRGK